MVRISEELSSDQRRVGAGRRGCKPEKETEMNEDTAQIAAILIAGAVMIATIILTTIYVGPIIIDFMAEVLPKRPN